MHEIIADLAERWWRARRSALRATWPAAAAASREDEEALVAGALEQGADDLLRRVFDVSLRLGEGFRRHHRMDLPLDDLAVVLPLLGAPCASRSWRRTDKEPALVGARPGCPAALVHPRACDYWREAIGGLVPSA